MIGDLLKELREDLNYTQSDISSLLNISRSTVSAYETNTAEPTLSNLVKLADLYNCSLDYLTGRTKERYNLNLFNKDSRKLILELIEVVDKYQVKKK